MEPVDQQAQKANRDCKRWRPNPPVLRIQNVAALLKLIDLVLVSTRSWQKTFQDLRQHAKQCPLIWEWTNFCSSHSLDWERKRGVLSQTMAWL